MQHPKRRHVSHRLKWKLAVSQAFKCALCRTTLGESFDVDHIIPLSKGGRDHPSNLNLLCLCCHRSKSTMESVARNKKTDGYHCDVCDVEFSPHFLHRHLHNSRI